MSINLMKMLQDQMGSAVVDQASKFLGESSSNTSSGISALLPSLIGGLMSKGSTESGASGILDMLTKGNHDGGILDNLGNVFSGGSSTSNFMNAGSLLTSALFGGSKLGSVLDIVTKATGMRRSSSSSLMNLLAPIVMGMVGKYVRKNGLNAGGLMKMLMGQKDHVSSALPAGMGSILGFADMKDSVSEKVTAATTRTASAARETVRETANVATDAAATGGSWLRWALPLLAILGLGAWLFTRGGAEKVANATGDAVGTVVDGTKTVAGAAADGATKTINAAGDAASSAATTMKDGANAAGNAVAGAAGTVKDAAGNVVSGAADAAGNVAADAKDGANKLGAKIKNAADKTGEAVGNAANKTGEAVGKAGTAAAGALSAAGVKAKETFSGMFKTGSTASAYTLNGITWDPSGNKITNYNKDEVMALAAALKADPNAKIQVQAFSNTGKNAVANKAMAVTRAKVIQQILTTLGVKASQLSTKGSAAKGADNANAVQIVVK